MTFPTPADFERLVQSSGYCILLHDADTKDIRWANQAACDLLGFTVDELKPLKAPDMSSSEKRYRREVGVQWLQDAVDQGRSSIEWRYRSKAGRDILTEAIAILVDLDDRPTIMVQFRDIEKEDSLKRNLTRTTGRLDAFMMHMVEGILVVDEQGAISFASDSAAAHLGRPVDELVAAGCRDFCAPESWEQLRRMLVGEFPFGTSRNLRLRVFRPDGHARWYETTCQRIAIESDLAGFLLLFHDITEQVASEIEHNRDLEYLNYLGRYNAMGDMAMAIAHELGQPLTAARNFIEGVALRAERPGVDSAQLAYGLENAQLQLTRANQIISSLREFVVNLEQSEQIVDLNAIVEDCLYFIRLRAAELHVDIAVERHASPLYIRCEKVLTGQVVLNLSQNAIEEMAEWPAGSRLVTIRTLLRDGSAVFEVSDAGKGLAHIPDDRVFDGAFTSKAVGSGIGLALSHRIITRQHGQIFARPNRPRGAVFSFEFALALAESAEDGKQA